MNKWKVLGVAVLSGSILSFSGGAKHLCEGFLPENNLRVPVSVMQVGGLTKSEFDGVLDQIQKFYGPIIGAKGGKLQINREWEDDTVNASAIQYGNTWVINMYGGLARYPTVSADGFALVACHEIGHHLGGAPKISGWSGSWATNEGGADYFASIRCMRLMFTDNENLAFVKTTDIDPVLRNTCETTYNNQADENLCMRVGMAGMNVTNLFKALKNETVQPQFNTPDPSVVGETDDSHPASQCRLDTYYQGGLCVTNVNDELSDSDYHVGTCTARSHTIGLRPRCWFKPDEASLLDVGPQASN